MSYVAYGPVKLLISQLARRALSPLLKPAHKADLETQLSQQNASLGLFNNALSSPDYTASNGRVISKQRIGMEMALI